MKNEIRKYVLALIAVRQNLIASNRSYKNTANVLASIKRINTWLDFYPNADDRQVARFISSRWPDILNIIPGETAKNHHAIKSKLSSLIHGNQIPQ
jgi:Cft2 family RNA processing exonuclease